jgi:hypothetical protein
MKTFTFSSAKDNSIQEVVNGLYMNIGNEMQGGRFPLDVERSFQEEIPLYLYFFSNGSDFPLFIELNDKGNHLLLSRISQNLFLLTNNNKPIVYFANQGGVFEIPEDFSGILFFSLTYEKIFPDFACLPDLTGLCITGYLDNIQNWEALAGADKLKIFSIDTYKTDILIHIKCQPNFLQCTSSMVEKAEPALLINVQILITETGERKIFEKIFRMPSLQKLFLQTNFELSGQEEFVTQLEFITQCAQIANIFDPGFPLEMNQITKEKTNSYSVYMSTITEDIKKYGKEDKGFDVVDIYEQSGDYPMESRSWTEIKSYGLSNGDLFFKRADKNLVHINLKAAREKALLILNKIKGLQLSIEKEKYVAPIKSVHSEKKLNKEYKDHNEDAFKIKTALFKEIVEREVVPVFKYVVEELTERSVDAEYRFDHENFNDPKCYTACVWFMIYNKERSKWGTFQYNQNAYTLEPINFFIWDPEEWKNSNSDINLNEITRERVKSDLDKFLNKLAKPFKFSWEQ